MKQGSVKAKGSNTPAFRSLVLCVRQRKLRRSTEQNSRPEARTFHELSLCNQCATDYALDLKIPFFRERALT